MLRIRDISNWAVASDPVRDLVYSTLVALCVGACTSAPTLPQDTAGSIFMMAPDDRATEIQLGTAVHGLIDLLQELDAAAEAVTAVDEKDPLSHASLIAAVSSAEAYVVRIQAAERRAKILLEIIGTQVATFRFTSGREVATAAVPRLRNAVFANLGDRTLNAREWVEFHQWVLSQRGNFRDADDNPSTMALAVVDTLQRLRDPLDVGAVANQRVSAALEAVLDPLRTAAR